MRGALLRSGKSESFTALGETGQPVYRAALQLREAIKRTDKPGTPEADKKLLHLHLAIPQSNENGNQIDWYSEIEGDVIPWSAATETERASAREQLKGLEKALQALSAQYLGTDTTEQQGDKAVFGKLLTRVVTLPDENYVYLVDGKAVITFWGFLHPDADRSLEPLHCLEPKPLKFDLPPEQPAVVAPPPVAPARIEQTVERRPWWRRWSWWWLVPLLLLLWLLLFGLRSCVPSLGLGALPGFPHIDVPKVGSTEVGSTELPTIKTPKVDLPGMPTGSAPGLPAPELPAGGTGGEPAADATLPSAEVPEQAPAGGQAEAPVPPSEPAATEPEPSPPAPPTLPAPTEQATANASAPPLSIPEGSQDGVADFLNGHYRAGAGIQDRRTGKPLRLEYQFKDGKGDVTVSRADGVACTGPVTAAMKGGNLSIDSHGQAACADGSNYDMPKVDCKPGAKSIADCTGGYANEQFPMSMRQTGE